VGWGGWGAGWSNRRNRKQERRAFLFLVGFVFIHVRGDPHGFISHHGFSFTAARFYLQFSISATRENRVRCKTGAKSVNFSQGPRDDRLGQNDNVPSRFIGAHHNKSRRARMESGLPNSQKANKGGCLIVNQKLWPRAAMVVKSVNLDTCRIQFICARYMALLNT